ncbi:YlmC/YmxH family sporulation protein [Halonatronum saccharophilum]|uniref:YlmC/YmxH family sporulation protein n=1 Tax=Halonatronum saccharophilum TaxID=150060 RepID=UPI000485294F|nr:YlmC/YmxH family sporulation protein [Halonatronum saccharophilum]
MIKTSELKLKEVVNINNGQKLGMIVDIDIDLVEGKVKGISVPKEGKGFKFFGANEEIYIKWNDIHRIGDDVILVRVAGLGDALVND